MSIYLLILVKGQRGMAPIKLMFGLLIYCVAYVLSDGYIMD
jgi:hypothetical protein